MKRSVEYHPILLVVSLIMLLSVLLTKSMGGYTTSIEAGMAFLDWPLSNGSINPEGWLKEKDKFAEHSHRLFAAGLGFFSIVFLVLCHLKEARKSLRLAAWALFLLILSQGLLGGSRVVFDQLNTQTDHNLVADTMKVMHAFGAQLIVLLLVTITLMQTKFFVHLENVRQKNYFAKPVRLWGVSAIICLLLTILAGALVRHTDSGLALPYFPETTIDGGWIPEFWNTAISLHFAHRFMAVASTVALFVFFGYLWGASRSTLKIKLYTLIPMTLLVVQILLGGLTVLTQINEYAATLHLLVGAFLLASTWCLVFFTLYLSREKKEFISAPSSAPEGAVLANS